MASPQSSEHVFSRQALKMYDHDPDATTAVDVAWVDLQNFHRFAIGVFHSVGTGSFTAVKILANNASDGSGTDIVIKSHALGSQPDAVGDQVFLECTAEEIAQEAADAGLTGVRYVTANVQLGTGTDECVVLYVRSEPRFNYDGLTADVIA